MPEGYDSYGGLHGAEHAFIAMMPMFVLCDRWDIGGVSMPAHAENVGPVVFVYDGYEGGIGLSEKKSVTPDYLVCLEDGIKLKMLKRHLRTAYDMTPEQYREKWSLPADYPMVAPNYAKKRSSLAREFGLGRGGPKRPTRRRG